MLYSVHFFCLGEDPRSPEKWNAQSMVGSEEEIREMLKLHGLGGMEHFWVNKPGWEYVLSDSGSNYMVSVYQIDESTFEVTIEGRRVIAYNNIDGSSLKPGDMYIAKRNTEWQLAKCLYVDLVKGWVASDPIGKIYSYDCCECRKVKEIVEGEIQL